MGRLHERLRRATMSTLFGSGNPAATVQRTCCFGLFFACAALASMLVAAGGAPPPAPQSQENWVPFERLVAQSEKAMMADPATALARARAATEFADHHRPSMRYAEAAATG